MGRHSCLSIIILVLLLLANEKSPAQQRPVQNWKQELQFLQKQIVPDKRTAVLELSLSDSPDGIVILKGKTNLPDGKNQIIQWLNVKKIRVTDSITLLPDPQLGEKTWAIVTLSVASMRNNPNHAAEMATQALMGTPMKVLEFEDGWYRVQTPDQYIGWMEQHGLTLFSSGELEQWKERNRVVFNRITGNAFESATKNGAIVTDLVLGDILQVEGEQNGFVKIKIPDGRIGFIDKADCLSWKEWTNRPPDTEAAISTARQLLGLPYLWGGTSTKAIDCSGLTKTSWFSQGVILARDASQQALYGEHPDFSDRKNLKPGDLLFFGEEKEHITHVGLYMGNDLYIHSSGLVRINSLDPDAENYIPGTLERLVATSRITGSFDTEGITLVSSHPWYN